MAFRDKGLAVIDGIPGLVIKADCLPSIPYLSLDNISVIHHKGLPWSYPVLHNHDFGETCPDGSFRPRNCRRKSRFNTSGGLFRDVSRRIGYTCVPSGL